MPPHDLFRPFRASALTVGSTSTVSTAPFDGQTRAVRLSLAAAVASNTGIWFRVDTDTVSSSNASYLPGGWSQEIKVSPGERANAIGSAAAAVLNVTELT